MSNFITRVMCANTAGSMIRPEWVGLGIDWGLEEFTSVSVSEFRGQIIIIITI